MSTVPKVPNSPQQMNFSAPPVDASPEDQLNYACSMLNSYKIKLNNFQQDLGLTDYDIDRLNSLVNSISFYESSVTTWSIILGVKNDV